MTALISVLVIGLGAKRAKPIRRVPIWPMGNSRTESEQHLEPAEHSLSLAKVKSLIPKWVFTTGGDVSATLTVAGDLVYFPDLGWQSILSQEEQQSRAIRDGRVGNPSAHEGNARSCMLDAQAKDHRVPRLDPSATEQTANEPRVANM